MPERTEERSLWPRLRERKVVQWGVAYAAAAWLLLEVAGFAAEWFDVPGTVVRGLTALLALGLVAALVLAWYHGEKGQQSVSRMELGLLVLLGIIATTTVGFFADSPSAQRTEATAGARDPARIAVLYFDDFSPDGAYRFLAESFTESLIHELSQVEGLDVVSRTAVKAFRSAAITTDSIVRLLNVGTLIEGSIETGGDRLTVTVQLISASTGSHSFSERLERSGADLLELREELVRKSVALLRAHLGRTIEMHDLRVGTRNAAAWESYARGQSLLESAFAPDLASGERRRALERAEQFYYAAVASDPQWTEPRVALAEAAYRHARLEDRGNPAPAVRAAWIDSALVRVQPVLDRNPLNARALEVRGTTRYYRFLVNDGQPEVQHLLSAARNDLQNAVQLDPNRTRAWLTLSHLFLSSGDVAAALDATERAAAADPYFALERFGGSSTVLYRLFHLLYNSGQFSDASRWCDEGQKWYPDLPQFALCELRLLTSPLRSPDINRAWDLVARIDSLSPPAIRQKNTTDATLWTAAVIAGAAQTPFGRAALADSAKRVTARALSAIPPSEQSAYALIRAYVHALLGENGTAIELLRNDLGKSVPLSELDHWWWRELRNDPEFAALREG